MKRLEKLITEASSKNTLAGMLNDFVEEAGSKALNDNKAHIETIKPGVSLGVHFKGQSRGDINFSAYIALQPKDTNTFELNIVAEYGMWQGGKDETESVRITDSTDDLAKKIQKHLTF